MANFDNEINYLMKAEGGLNTNSSDRGGLTKYGISKRAHPNLDIANLTPDQAKHIYKRHYWDAIDGDNLSPEMATVAFDSAVNHGVVATKNMMKSSGMNPYAMIQKRKKIYDDMAKSDPTQKQFHAGWMDRLASTAGRVGDFFITPAWADETPWQPNDNEALHAKFSEWKAEKQARQPANDLHAKFAEWKKSKIENDPTLLERAGQNLKDNIGGAVRGAGSIGATLLAPIDAGAKELGIENSWIGRDDRREAMDAELKSTGVDTDSANFKIAKTIAEAAGTAGIGGALGKGALALAPKMPAVLAPVLARLAPTLESSGMVGKTIADRAVGGAISGGAQAFLVNPDDAGIGAAIGGTLPVASTAALKAGGLVAPLFTGKTNAANQIVKQLGDDVDLQAIADNIDATPQFTNIADIKPTMAMTTKDQSLLKLEHNARARNKGGEFFQRDSENAAKTYRAIEKNAIDDVDANIMQDTLNKKTGKLREAAFEKARQNPSYRDDLKSYLDYLENKPGIRESEAMPLVNRGKKSLILDENFASHADPEDVYAFRKVLSDKLKLKTITPDELDNAIKIRRKLSYDMKEQIDNALNKASNGAWSKYLKKHQAGMKPIDQGRAFQNIIDKFQTNKPIFGTDIPQMSAGALRKAVKNESYINLGKSGRASRVDDAGRATLDDAINVMNAIENARAGAMATSGSQTTPLLLSLGEQAIPGGKLSMMYRLANQVAKTKGTNVLNDALLNPEKLSEILQIAIRNKQPVQPSVVSPYLYKSLPAVAAD